MSSSVRGGESLVTPGVLNLLRQEVMMSSPVRRGGGVPINPGGVESVASGGDDVQQFCEAGEEEFLEIMALVGMASKPLHVRRLQKALQEWVQNPGEY